VFIPPFCPYEACKFHSHPPEGPWWRREGFHSTRCFGPVPRFRCLGCHRTFSAQTFSIDYYAKRKIDYRPLVIITDEKHEYGRAFVNHRLFREQDLEEGYSNAGMDENAVPAEVRSRMTARGDALIDLKDSSHYSRSAPSTTGVRGPTRGCPS